MGELGANQWNQQQFVAEVNQSDKPSGDVARRPPNAFILYSQEMRSSVQAENPTLSNIEISSLLGKMWKEVPSSSKLAYKQKAQMLQEEFKAKHPNYTYAKARRKRALNELLTKSTQNNYPGVLGYSQIDPSSLNYQIAMQQLYQQQMANGYQMQGNYSQQQPQQSQVNQAYGQYQTGQQYNVQQQYMYPQGYQVQQ
ncbi:HMG box family protein [Histomonas meleagridis]|uniref:HMG box family protein n=1 Tax=Histomonas meleagridis TaxID=135588 RepID=UPI003559884B|nr:HMG box family protein [Histomonas meleagridis]KAH0801915.1 HMG box family protein [Histomonas meleagridis]